jgi:hypothetical protein
MKIFELVVLQGAQSDLLSIYANRGERVYMRVDSALGILRAFPEIGPVKWGKRIRRLVVTKTTLGVFYSITGNRVMVAAIMDLRQSQQTIRKRLREL